MGQLWQNWKPTTHIAGVLNTINTTEAATGPKWYKGRFDWTRTTRTPAFWGYPPPPHDYPYHWVILDPKSKEDKVKVTNLKKSPKFQIFEFWNGHYTRHTFWSCLIRCANMKWIWLVFLKIQSGHDSVHRRTDGRTDRRTDGQTDKVIPVYPPINFVEAGGIINPLAPGGFEWNARYVILKLILVIDASGISSEIALRWLWLELTDGKSTLVQVMAWCS